MSSTWEKKIHIKVNGLYLEKVNTLNASFSTKKKLLVTLFSDDSKEREHYIVEHIQDIIGKLEKLGFKRDEITIESEVSTTETKTEKVEIIETEVDGKKTLSFEKPAIFKIKAILDNGIYATGGLFTNGVSSISSDGNGISFANKQINTEPMPIHTHPNTEELNEYDIVKFNGYFPHMNVKSGDMAVVVKADNYNVVVKKDGSTFPIARHHITKVKN